MGFPFRQDAGNLEYEIKTGYPMKRILLFSFVILLGAGFSLQAQKIRIPIKKKATEKTNEEIDKTIDEGLNKLFGKKKKDKGKSSTSSQPAGGNSSSQQTGTQTSSQDGGAAPAGGEKAASPSLNWSKYDFVPGDKVIFEDNLVGEENGEFPSRWDLKRGSVENAQFGGENVIYFRGGHPGIVPYLKDPEKDYLPDVFTVDFDFFTAEYAMDMYLYDTKHQSSPGDYASVLINNNGLLRGTAESELPGGATIKNKWTHIAIAYTHGKLKAYMDGVRLINIPHLEINPTGITLYSYSAYDRYPIYIKNFRIAEGGVKYYDRFLQDGKIVSNGIRFETGKAVLLPQSMGVLNKICDMLKAHPDVKFSIEGHTDNVGDADFNQKLSEERAAAVKTQLVKMGIDAGRLQTKGWGETKPVDSNDTPEGRANNRRVEFVKM